MQRWWSWLMEHSEKTYQTESYEEFEQYTGTGTGK